MSAIQRTKFSSFYTVVIDFTEIVNAQKGDAELQQLIDSNSSIKIPPPNEGSGIHTSLKQDLKDSTAKLLYGTTLEKKFGNKYPGKFTSALTLRPVLMYLFAMMPSKSPYNNHTMVLTK